MNRVIACLLAVVLATSSCATWWDNFKKDPVTQTERIITGVTTVINLATLLFGQIKPNLPADVQEDAQVEFDKAVLACARGQLALKSAVDAAKEAKQENPDLSKVIADVNDAVKHLQELVNGLKRKMAPRKAADGHFGAAPLVGEAEFDSAVRASLR